MAPRCLAISQSHVGEAIEGQREEGRGQWRALSWNPVRQYTSNVGMDIGELHHLLFRWLHVTTAVLWIGHTWSLVFAQHAHQPDGGCVDARLGWRSHGSPDSRFLFSCTTRAER